MKPSFIIVSLFIIFSNLSCSSLNDPLEDPESIEPSDVLELSIKGLNQLRSNGRDQTSIIARVPKDTGEIDITFKTTAGIFILTGSKEIKDFADSISGDYRYARVVLKSDSTIGPAYISAEIPQARRRVSIPFVE